ncbi:cell division protein ZapE [Rhodococcus sp. IEGM 1381]|uniref:cell division protein ZapE n=1 Tax=Rhodococcus sp. IEGM 1381 TaxID=3047085 RepID=UPI0024B63C6B|nr:cell division protein ZapE [Rhodococcus sp. IEGM 1381]MDI9893916.1 cell division protein ZapE [Rhodococcus sp. IEGM 1381]
MRPTPPRQIFDTDFVLDDAQAAAADALSTPGNKGIYLWGPVGRGKTWLLDTYFDNVATSSKKRVHFHSFFRDLHAAYFRRKFSIDAAIDDILSTGSAPASLLCFDEFHVHDIGDARLITRMLDALFARGVVLVVTSNYAPDELLPNTLFHPTFIPTIEKLKEQLDVVSVDGPVDYRAAGTSGSRFASGTWCLETGSGGHTFAELCCAARSTGDYLQMAEIATTLTVTEVPALASVDDFAAQRFSNLVDVLYDQDVRTDFHALVPLHEFAVGCAGLDTDRLMSRLSELKTPSSSHVATATTRC